MASVKYNQLTNLYVTLVLMTLQVNGFHRYSLNSELTIMTLDSEKSSTGFSSNMLMFLMFINIALRIEKS